MATQSRDGRHYHVLLLFIYLFFWKHDLELLHCTFVMSLQDGYVVV